MLRLIRILCSQGFKRPVNIISNTSLRLRYHGSIITLFPSLGHHSSIFTSSCYNAELFMVNAPSFADSITEGDIKWHCSVGEQVSEDELLGEIETDKTSLPIHSPHAGIIENLLVADGEKVIEGQGLLEIRELLHNPPVTLSNSFVKSNIPQYETHISNLTPSRLKTESLDSLPSIVEDLPFNSTSTIASPVSSVDETFTKPQESNTRIEKRIKMSRMRLKISERLKASQNTTAMLTTFNEIDMSNVISIRKQFQEQFFSTHGNKLGMMSIFLKSSAVALKKMPVINAVIDGNEIVYREYVDISVAVATSKGLVVPVIKNVINMSLPDIESTLTLLVGRANDNQLSIDDLYGGTFTVSNGGVFGSLYGTPIINPPQSAILGMHKIIDRPIVIDSQIVIRPMMYVALTYDHRLIDGREAVFFLKKIKSFVEEPIGLLLNI
eukprot:TRINITY_DN3567_c0_g2_i1.p1 TRINITY_DN3567_c0_g2~~TRINITY_DN3567_c0_g2_i1.p1  ORF type:complete len:439 (-),score=16.41 TRINITY_DN3567_c0_g2_i1:25-1341(-)